LKAASNSGAFFGFFGVGWWTGERPWRGWAINWRWEKLEMGGCLFCVWRLLRYNGAYGFLCVGDLKRKVWKILFFSLFFILVFFQSPPVAWFQWYFGPSFSPLVFWSLYANIFFLIFLYFDFLRNATSMSTSTQWEKINDFENDALKVEYSFEKTPKMLKMTKIH
jgi:hypothetical protein